MARANDKLTDAARTSALMVATLFAVKFLDAAYGLGLERFGIQPRTWEGLRGVVFSPLLHANLFHLLSNALPLFVLLTLLFWDRRYRPKTTLAMIWIASGLGTWLIGRGGVWHGRTVVHLGASSIIFGLVAYLIVAGIRMQSWRSAGVGLLVLLLFGGIFLGALPDGRPISWEGHLCGALAGVWAAVRNHR
jgi:membrane associated rhomboid family serine protease